jgi:hypothetical protein
MNPLCEFYCIIFDTGHKKMCVCAVKMRAREKRCHCISLKLFALVRHNSSINALYFKCLILCTSYTLSRKADYSSAPKQVERVQASQDSKGILQIGTFNSSRKSLFPNTNCSPDTVPSACVFFLRQIYNIFTPCKA